MSYVSLDAERLLRALRRLAVDGEVCATIRHLASESGLSETAVRRGLSELKTEPTGPAIRFAGRHGKTAVWRVKSDPLGHGAGATSEVPPPTAGGTFAEGGDPGEADRLDAGRPPVASVEGMAEPDDDELGEEEIERRRRAAMAASYAILDRLGGDELGEPDQPGGECADCGKEARRRYSLALLVLCRDCRLLRARAEVRTEAWDTVDPPAAAVQERELTEELTEQALDAIVEQHGANGNGNGSRAEDWIERPEIDY